MLLGLYEAAVDFAGRGAIRWCGYSAVGCLIFYYLWRELWCRMCEVMNVGAWTLLFWSFEGTYIELFVSRLLTLDSWPEIKLLPWYLFCNKNNKYLLIKTNLGSENLLIFVTLKLYPSATICSYIQIKLLGQFHQLSAWSIPVTIFCEDSPFGLSTVGIRRLCTINQSKSDKLSHSHELWSSSTSLFSNKIYWFLQ